MGPRRADGRWDVITAAHCTGNVGSVGEITLKTGQRYKVHVLHRATGPDITWMVLDGTPDTLPYAMVATSAPSSGTKVWHMGYGVDRPGNREEGTVTGGPAANGQLSFRLSVSSGDSGSGIFREDTGELVGVVCCTTGMGRQVTMYGGACTTALKIRPGGPGGASAPRDKEKPPGGPGGRQRPPEDEFNPVPIPEVPEALPSWHED
ncbi:MAG: trypsin-like peptidase domain-containing protein [Gemmataceae bacterium]